MRKMKKYINKDKKSVLIMFRYILFAIIIVITPDICKGVDVCTGASIVPDYVCGGCPNVAGDDCGYYWGDNDGDSMGGSNQQYHCSM